MGFPLVLRRSIPVTVLGVLVLLALPQQAAAEPVELTLSRSAAVRAREAYLSSLRDFEAALRKCRQVEDADAVAEQIALLQRMQIPGPAPSTAQQGPVPGQPIRWTSLAKVAETSAQVGFDAFAKNDPAKVDGVEYRRTLYAHAESVVTYGIKGRGYRRLRGRGGVRDGSTRSSVEFQIIGDGKPLWSARAPDPATGVRVTAEFDVDIANVSELWLRVDPLGGMEADWSVWIDPEIGR